MYNQQFKNYYILGSMNSCCTGGIVDGKINTEALKNTIALGPRFLDFEIYQKMVNPLLLREKKEIIKNGLLKTI